MFGKMQSRLANKFAKRQGMISPNQSLSRIGNNSYGLSGVAKFKKGGAVPKNMYKGGCEKKGSKGYKCGGKVKKGR